MTNSKVSLQVNQIAIVCTENLCNEAVPFLDCHRALWSCTDDTARILPTMLQQQRGLDEVRRGAVVMTAKTDSYYATHADFLGAQAPHRG